MYLRKDGSIYLIARITGMPKQINGLAAIAQVKQPKAVFSGSYFHGFPKNYVNETIRDDNTTKYEQADSVDSSII
mgnify:CR=1 FL=1